MHVMPSQREGTHREPAFKDCQQCGDTGLMEARLCGRLATADPALVGAQVTAAYRFAYDPVRRAVRGDQAPNEYQPGVQSAAWSQLEVDSYSQAAGSRLTVSRGLQAGQ